MVARRVSVSLLALLGSLQGTRASRAPTDVREDLEALGGNQLSDERVGSTPTSLLEGRALENDTALPMSTFIDGVHQAQQPQSAAQLAPTGASAANDSLTDMFRFSVVRIHSIETPMNWFVPFQRGSDVGAIGSGFAVQLETKAFSDPVFVTNAHVVRNAHTVRVQLPAVGQMDFQAYVPLIYEDFDLALVQLADPAAFQRFLEEQGAALKVLTIREAPVALGVEVAAMGFPLGSSSLKLSRGVIAGTEQVDGHLVFQSTAPISPGSSGGPLFAISNGARGLAGEWQDASVIGANFAASADSMAQNANYVVPAIHVTQLLNEFWRVSQLQAVDSGNGGTSVPAAPAPEVDREDGMMIDGNGTSGPRMPNGLAPIPVVARSSLPADRTSRSAGGRPAAANGSSDVAQAAPRPGSAHAALRFAPVAAVIVEANEVLYNSSGGCGNGVYVSRIESKSALRTAQPAVPEDSFIVAVGDVALDSFGMGHSKGFLGDPVPFESIMALQERVEDPVNLTVCRRGKVSLHTVSMVWSADEYENGINVVTEPTFHPKDTDYEYFSDLVVMQLTVNHVLELLKMGRPVTLGRWMLPENMAAPRLIVAYVKSGTYASRILAPGMVVNTLNGANVSTLRDFRRHFQPEGRVWRLETERGVVLEADFQQAVDEQLAQAMAGPEFGFLRTKAFVSAVQNRSMHTEGAGIARVKAVDLNDLLQHAYELGVHTGIAAASHMAFANSTNTSADNNSLISLSQRSVSSVGSRADVVVAAAGTAATSRGEANRAKPEFGQFSSSLSPSSPLLRESFIRSLRGGAPAGQAGAEGEGSVPHGGSRVEGALL